MPVVINNRGTNARQRHLSRTRFGVRDTGQRADHDRTRFGLPPGVDNRSATSADGIAVPNPSLGIDWFTDRTEHAKAGQVEGIRDFATEFHKSANRGWCGVQNRHTVFLYDFPPSTGMGCVWSSFVDNLRRTVCKWPVSHVTVAGDPADVGCAPVDVGFRFQIEDVSMREAGLC